APARSWGVMRVGGSASRLSAQRSTTASAPGASRSSRRRARTPASTLSAALAEEARPASGTVAGGTASGTVAGGTASGTVAGGDGPGDGGFGAGQGGAPAGQAGLGVAQHGVGPLPVRTVVVREQGHPEGHGVYPVRDQA